MRASCILLSLVLATPCLAQAPEQMLGKLFLTPEKRQVLEQRRQLNLGDTESEESDILQLDGVVQRSSGYNSIWVNQRMLDSKRSGVHVQPNQPATATIDADSPSSVRLKVGDAVNRSTQEQKPLVAPDAVRTGKKP